MRSASRRCWHAHRRSFIGEGSQGVGLRRRRRARRGEHRRAEVVLPARRARRASGRRIASWSSGARRATASCGRPSWSSAPASPASATSCRCARPRSVGLADLLTGKVDVPFSTVCTLGMELADSFLALHSQGLCYRDISFGNVFFDPATGRPLICDNDNVGIDGATPSLVLGTRRFMAPEIVRREAAPSTAHRPVLAVGAALLRADGRPPAGRSARARLRLLGRPGRERAVRPRAAVRLRPERRTRTRRCPTCTARCSTNWELYPDRIRAAVHHRVHHRPDRPPQRPGARERVAHGAGAAARRRSCGARRAARRTSGTAPTPPAGPAIVRLGSRCASRSTDVPLVSTRTPSSGATTCRRATTTTGRRPRDPPSRTARRWGLRNETSTPCGSSTLPSGETTTAGRDGRWACCPAPPCGIGEPRSGSSRRSRREPRHRPGPAVRCRRAAVGSGGRSHRVALWRPEPRWVG